MCRGPQSQADVLTLGIMHDKSFRKIPLIKHILQSHGQHASVRVPIVLEFEYKGFNHGDEYVL